MSGLAAGRRGSGFAGVREASVGIVVIRADGSREPRGLVSYYHENVLRRLLVGGWVRWRARRLELRFRSRLSIPSPRAREGAG